MEPVSLIVKAILAFTIIINALLILFIYSGRQRGIIRTLFLFHLLGIIGWAASILVVLQSGSLIAARLTFVCALIFASAKFYFVLIFPENKLPQKVWHYIPIGIATTALIFASIPNMVFTQVTVVDGYYMNVDTGPFSSAYSIIIATLLLFPIYVLILKYVKGAYSEHTKEQLKYLSIGSAIFFIISLSTNLILPVYFNIYFFNGLGPAFSLIFVSFIFFIISRHHFLGLKLIIQRGFIYSVLFFFIVSFYLSIITLTGFFLEQITQTTILVNAGITTLLGIFTVPYIDRFLRKRTDRFFFKDTYNYAETLYELSEKIHATVFVEDIRDLTEKTLQHTLKTSIVIVRFVFKDEDGLINQIENHDRTTLTIPIIFNKTLIGTIFLGEKNSGDSYTSEDIVLLKTFAHQIAGAFEKAKLYKEVQEYSKELEKRVEERTVQIANLQKHQTSMMLDISHKLQNPLTIVKTQLNLIRRDIQEKETLDFFEKTIDDISAFIYDLLHLARLDSIPAANLEKKDINLSDSLSELAEYFEVMARQNNITFASTIAPNIHFRCDKTQITELLTNLVSNAVKYCKKDSSDKRITMSLAADATTIKLIVGDNGKGIVEEDVPYIFDRFYRTASTQGVRGTGLGLAICKRIVELHAGSIAVASKLGEGATFTCTFTKNETPVL